MSSVLDLRLAAGVALLAAILLAVAAALALRSVRRERALKERFERLLLTFAHDLKTPVAVARLHAERLAEGMVTDPARVRDQGHILLEATSTLTGRIDQLIDQVRGLEGRITRGRDPVPLPEILQEVVRDVTPLARDASLSIELDATEPALELTGDRAALTGALRNLLTNAVKFARRGTTVRVGFQRVAGEAWIWVRDEGAGIARHELEALGQPFYRAVLTHDVPGSGLGLAQVKATVESHGGRVEVASREGEGTLFTLALPAGGGA